MRSSNTELRLFRCVFTRHPPIVPLERRVRVPRVECAFAGRIGCDFTIIVILLMAISQISGYSDECLRGNSERHVRVPLVECVICARPPLCWAAE